MNIETQQRMIGVIRNSFDTNLTIVAELLHCERRNVADVFYKGKSGGLNTDQLLFVFIQSKQFAKMNYIRPDYMFMRPVLGQPSIKQHMIDRKEIGACVLPFLKTVDTLEAETRARGQGKTSSKPFRSAREAADDISTPYFGESYNYGQPINDELLANTIQ